jgi:hypothetical protein
MSQQRDFTGRFRSQERSFFSEAQFLKFARPRGKDDLTNLVRAAPNLSMNPTLIDAPMTTEPERSRTLAKRASA